MNKTLIILHSYHHGNTAKVAAAIADALGAEVKSVQDVTPADLDNCGLIGFGSGIGAGRHYPPLLNFVKTLPDLTGRRVFIFSTSGMFKDASMENLHKTLRSLLLSKGCAVIGEFGCKGYITFGPFKLFGGVSKGHPDKADLKSAEQFAKKLLSK